MAKSKRKNPSPIKFYTSLIDQIKTNKIAFAVYIVLRLAVIFVMIRCAINKQYESLFISALCLILFLVPPFVEKNFKIELPTVLETLVFIFIFCAEILGEIGDFYEKYAFWDSTLHTTTGFIFAGFGFCLIDIINRNSKIKFQMSPIYVALTAFCFSMTIGVLWEFFEFGADYLFLKDMQKDRIVTAFTSVHFPINGETITNITKTTIEYADGKSVIIENGYLDIGIIDTIKDLFVNFIGAVVFSVIGFFYIKHRGKGKIASQFIPVLVESDDSGKPLSLNAAAESTDGNERALSKAADDGSASDEKETAEEPKTENNETADNES